MGFGRWGLDLLESFGAFLWFWLMKIRSVSALLAGLQRGLAFYFFWLQAHPRLETEGLLQSYEVPVAKGCSVEAFIPTFDFPTAVWKDNLYSSLCAFGDLKL